eukprot:sb/3466143/
MAIFSAGKTSSPDLPLFILFILLPLLSIPLNLLVFHHNYSKPPSVARTLYLILSFINTIANPYIALQTALGLWSAPDIVTCTQTYTPLNRTSICTEQYYIAMTDVPDLPCAVYTTVMWGLYFGPIIATGYLTITRYFQIKYPFRHVRACPIVLSMLACFLFIAAGNVLFYWSGWPNSTILVNYSQICLPILGVRVGDISFSQDLIILIMETPVVIIQVLGIICSSLTLVELVARNKNPIGGIKVSNNGTVKVLIMNTGSFLNFVLVFGGSLVSTQEMTTVTWIDLVEKVENTEFSVIVFTFFVFKVLPNLVTLAVPMIYLSYTPDARMIVRKWMMGSSCRTRQGSSKIQPKNF